MNEMLVFEKGNTVVVSSRTIADRFGKRHDNVLRDIKTIIKGLLKNEETPGAYFVESMYQENQNGEMYPEFLMNRDGFSLLVMGFTGDEALLWKVRYIQAFNAMEAALRERQSTEWLITRKQGKLVRRNETDVIAQLIEYAEAQGSKNMRKKAYLTYTKLVNGLVGIGAGQRDSVPFKTLSTIAFLEDMILHTVSEEMRNGTYYKEIYRRCKANGEQIMRFAYLPSLTA